MVWKADHELLRMHSGTYSLPGEQVVKSIPFFSVTDTPIDPCVQASEVAGEQSVMTESGKSHH